MEFIAILMLFWLLFGKMDKKALPEQTTTELKETYREKAKTISEVEDAIVKAEKQLLREREEQSKLLANPVKHYRKYRLGIILMVSVTLLIILTTLVGIALLSVDSNRLPEGLASFIDGNRDTIGSLLSLTSTYLLIILACSLPILFIKFLIFAVSLTMQDDLFNKDYKKTKLEIFVDNKKKYMAATESRYIDYFNEMNKKISDLKIEQLEIDELIDKKEQLRHKINVEDKERFMTATAQAFLEKNSPPLTKENIERIKLRNNKRRTS